MRKKIPRTTCIACDKIMERALVGLTFSQDIIIFNTAVFPSSQSVAALCCSACESDPSCPVYFMHLFNIIFHNEMGRDLNDKCFYLFFFCFYFHVALYTPRECKLLLDFITQMS